MRQIYKQQIVISQLNKKDPHWSNSQIQMKTRSRCRGKELRDVLSIEVQTTRKRLKIWAKQCEPTKELAQKPGRHLHSPPHKTPTLPHAYQHNGHQHSRTSRWRHPLHRRDLSWNILPGRSPSSFQGRGSHHRRPDLKAKGTDLHQMIGWLEINRRRERKRLGWRVWKEMILKFLALGLYFLLLSGRAFSWWIWQKKLAAWIVNLMRFGGNN